MRITIEGPEAIFSKGLDNKIIKASSNINTFFFQYYQTNWRASETLIGLNNGNRRYMYIYIYREREYVRPHFSGAGIT